MKQLYGYLFSILVILGCSTNETSTVKIEDTPQPNAQPTAQKEVAIKQTLCTDKPFNGVEKEFQVFNYNSKKGGRYELPSGTMVDIPKNAFVDKDGNEVDKNIEIKYREYHNVEDVILSGIKMNYAEGDTSGDFESAGMFEIRAKSGELDLALKDDKSIGIELASFKEGNFKTYCMNENKNQWEYVEESSPTQNTRKTERLAEVSEEIKAKKSTPVPCNVEPVLYEEDMELFDLDFNPQEYGEMDIFRQAMWTADGDAEHTNLLRASLKSYDAMELSPSADCNVYQLSLFNRDNFSNVTDKKIFNVKPVWSEAGYKKVKKDYSSKVLAFNAELKAIAQRQAMIRREADLVRSFSIQGMGIYNCDRVIDPNEFVAIPLELICSSEINSFFYITFNRSASIRYYQPKVEQFKYIPESTNSIIAILPDNKTAIVTEKMFANAYESYQADSNPNKKLKLQVKIQENEVKKVKDFEENYAQL